MIDYFLLFVCIKNKLFIKSKMKEMEEDHEKEIDVFKKSIVELTKENNNWKNECDDSQEIVLELQSKLKHLKM